MIPLTKKYISRDVVFYKNEAYFKDKKETINFYTIDNQIATLPQPTVLPQIIVQETIPTDNTSAEQNDQGGEQTEENVHESDHGDEAAEEQSVRRSSRVSQISTRFRDIITYLVQHPI
jgi:hypothetical protein